MRYIDKSKNPCSDFICFVEKHKAELVEKHERTTLWESFKKNHSDMYTTLHDHLVAEQQGLCIYCEQKIEKKPLDTLKLLQQHVEHVIPKEKNPETLSFDYGNLAVSCGGFEKLEDNGNKHSQYCGHKKGKKYDEHLFLSPFRERDLAKYFVYRFSGKGIEIRENSELSPEEQERAKYMIQKNLLDLNHPLLCNLRQEEYDLFLVYINNGDEETVKQLLDDQGELYNFYSMLRYMFRNLFLPTDN